MFQALSSFVHYYISSRVAKLFWKAACRISGASFSQISKPRKKFNASYEQAPSKICQICNFLPWNMRLGNTDLFPSSLFFPLFMPHESLMGSSLWARTHTHTRTHAASLPPLSASYKPEGEITHPQDLLPPLPSSPLSSCPYLPKASRSKSKRSCWPRLKGT